MKKITVIGSFSDPKELTKSIYTEEIDSERKERLSARWWASNYDTSVESKEERKALLPSRLLIKKILSFGGHEVCMAHIDEDVHEVLEKGVFIFGDDVRLMRGRPNGCHENSSALWDCNKDDLILMTGYALSEDGMWRCHSWCVGVETGLVIETTELRVAYFGFALSPNEAAEFFRNNN